MLKIFSNPISTKINPKWIINDHLATFVDGRSKRHWQDYFTFLVLPFIIACGLKKCGAELNADVVDIINTGLALFAGLFLSVSIQLQTIDTAKLRSESAKKVRVQMISNISFLILISLVSIIFSYASLFDFSGWQMNGYTFEWLKPAIDVVVYWLVGVFFLTVTMVLKRTSDLFSYLHN